MNKYKEIILNRFKDILGTKNVDYILSFLEQNNFQLRTIDDEEHQYRKYSTKYKLEFVSNNQDYLYLDFYFNQNKNLNFIVITVEFSFYGELEFIRIKDVNELHKVLSKIVQLIDDYFNKLLENEKIWEEVRNLLKNDKSYLDRILVYLKLNNFKFSHYECRKWIKNAYTFNFYDGKLRDICIHFDFHDNLTIKEISLQIYENNEEICYLYFNNIIDVEKTILEYI